jgi:two-component system sensor histidine kinase BaeS
MRPPWRTLRGRLALGSLVGLLVASLAFAALATELLRSQRVADQLADLEKTAGGIADLMSEDAERDIQGPFAEFNPPPERIAKYEQIVGEGTSLGYQGVNLSPGSTGAVGGLERVVLDQLDEEATEVQRFDVTDPATGKEAIAAAAPIVLNESIVGHVILLRERDAVVSVWRSIASRVVIAAGIGLAFALALTLLLTRRALRPLSRLQDAAAEVGKGNLDTRVEPGGAEEINSLATAFNTMVRELQHRDTLTRDFLMRVTHDLRTPLTAIRGHAQALADGVVPEQSVQRSLNAIDDESGRLDALVTDLLDLAKLEARRFRLELGNVDGNELVDRAFHAFAGEAARRGMTYERDIKPLPALFTDEARVRQIVGNLIDNAFRWTPDGGAVRLIAHPRPGGGAVISVTDTGPGISPDQLDDIFQPFRSENTPDGQHGSGLGLAISRQLARALGGDLRVESHLGRGTRFTLELPAEAQIPALARA